MTPREKAILALTDAAEQAGLDPLIEIPDHVPPYAVDLRVVRDGQVIAAMRVRIEGREWRLETPARPGGVQERRVLTRHLQWVDKKITPKTLEFLDPWLAQVPGTGRAPAPIPPRRREDVPAWMRRGYWEERLGIPVGVPH